MSMKELISLQSLIFSKKNSFTDLRVSVDTGKRLKMAVCDNLNPRIFMSFLLPTKERALCTSKDS